MQNGVAEMQNTQCFTCIKLNCTDSVSEEAFLHGKNHRNYSVTFVAFCPL